MSLLLPLLVNNSVLHCVLLLPLINNRAISRHNNNKPFYLLEFSLALGQSHILKTCRAWSKATNKSIQAWHRLCNGFSLFTMQLGQEQHTGCRMLQVSPSQHHMHWPMKPGMQENNMKIQAATVAFNQKSWGKHGTRVGDMSCRKSWSCRITEKHGEQGQTTKRRVLRNIVIEHDRSSKYNDHVWPHGHMVIFHVMCVM